MRNEVENFRKTVDGQKRDSPLRTVHNKKNPKWNEKANFDKQNFAKHLFASQNIQQKVHSTLFNRNTYLNHTKVDPNDNLFFTYCFIMISLVVLKSIPVAVV